ncbi:MAG TPA: c-type cytochrome [Kofleriaceae bacterium]|nr:c-type cytochrome [Kofleriaceae bacterium]
MRALPAVALAAAIACGCGDTTTAPQLAPKPTPGEAAQWSDAWLLAQTSSYVSDAAARRAALESSLANPANMYSRIRLASYGLESRGWDLLPVWNPRSIPVTAELLPALERGESPTLPAGQPPLWNGVTPSTMPEWIALGRRVFFEYPMRAEVFMEYALTDSELAAAVGIQRTRDGALPGLVVFANVDGETRVGITCAICHSTVKNGEVVVGQARRAFDYGRLRLTFDRVHGTVRSAEEAKRMASWGPGRADVTEDDDEDPVAIPDLWGLRHQRWLTQAGTIRHDSPLALAIRQETQLTDSNHARVRPPRELAWALAMFVYSLSPPTTDAAPPAQGEALFREHCARCHANAAYGGNTIAAATIGTDPALATGRGRGTGKYRVPTLLDVRDGAPYLHDGSVGSLAELLSPTRAAPGHRAGTQLVQDDRDALIAFLETL